MLQSEFYERTNVNMSGEEYAEVEAIYVNCKMNKDEFCKLWLENRHNSIISELMESIKEKDSEIMEKEKELESLKNKLEEVFSRYEEELQQMSNSHSNRMEDFGRNLILYLDDEIRLYDIIAEELGFGFICKVKLEEDVELTKEERDYLIKKLI